MPISVSKWNVGLREGKWGNVLVSLQDLLVDWGFFYGLWNIGTMLSDSETFNLSLPIFSSTTGYCNSISQVRLKPGKHRGFIRN